MGQKRWMRAVLTEAKAKGEDTATRLPFARQARAARKACFPTTSVRTAGTRRTA
ncbi:MAG: hypothetical protein AAFP13_04340 [Pseudomonadota bacterium]